MPPLELPDDIDDLVAALDDDEPPLDTAELLDEDALPVLPVDVAEEIDDSTVATSVQYPSTLHCS
jgi:hypothetical protein